MTWTLEDLREAVGDAQDIHVRCLENLHECDDRVAYNTAAYNGCQTGEYRKYRLELMNVSIRNLKSAKIHERKARIALMDARSRLHERLETIERLRALGAS